MDEREWLAERFEEHRTHLRAVAYRMLGSVSEADDAVQEAWLRLSRSDAREIENLGGWLTTVVGRVCLNMLRSRSDAREDLLEVHVPEPIVSREDGLDPSTRRCSPTPSASRCWSCSRRCTPPSGSRSCSTTCSRCRSTTSRRSSVDPPPTGGGHGGGREPRAPPGSGRAPVPDADLARGSLRSSSVPRRRAG